MSDNVLTADEIAGVKQYVRDLAHPDNGIDGVHAVIDFWNENPGLYDAVHVPDANGVTINNPGRDPQAVLDKYIRKTGAAAKDWVDGMQNPRADFKTAAVAARGKWADAVQRAIQNDHFAKAMAQVDSAEAIATAVSDNGNAYVSGISKRKAKVGRAFQRVIPALGAISQQIRQMPQDTPGDRTARMVQNLELVRSLKGKV